ncbi:MAG TPA: hypothetical protein VE136_17045 [Anaerolineales bacterium]|jgi:hypothetical protein|nr:hypothetical protein [Anaerolineales bacterium]
MRAVFVRSLENVFLQRMVADAQRLMALAQEMQASLAQGDPARGQIALAGQLLGQLIDQDVDLTGEQARLKEGVSRDYQSRVPEAAGLPGSLRQAVALPDALWKRWAVARQPGWREPQPAGRICRTPFQVA